jgi:hypothetical protein
MSMDISRRAGNLTRCWLALVLLAAGSMTVPASAVVAATPFLWGATGGNLAGTLYRLDPSTGAILQTVGAVTVGGLPVNVAGLAVHPTSGVLYATTGDGGLSGGAPQDSFYTIDKTTGGATRVGALSGASCTVKGLAFRSDGTLFGHGSCGNQVYTINLTTGAATALPSGADSCGRGCSLGFLPGTGGSQVLYGSTGGDGGPLDTINQSTGAVTTRMPLSGGIGRVLKSMTANPSGTLLLAARGQRGCGSSCATDLVSLDPATGATISLGALPINLEGLALDTSSLVGTPPGGAIPGGALARSFTVTEGQGFSGTVATFTDAGSSAAASAYSATIAWGDGSTSAGSLTGSAGSYTVAGSHTYATAGTFAVAVSIYGPNNASAYVTGTATVPEADRLIGTGAPLISATEGTALHDIGLATFVNRGFPANPASGFSATIDWGDGTSLDRTGVVSGNGPAGGSPYTVRGTHAFLREGVYPVRVTLAEGAPAGSTTGSTPTTLPASGPAQSSAQATTTVNVQDADHLAGRPLAITATAGMSFAGPVAAFTDTYPLAGAADFAATINWGDGTSPTSGVVVATLNGGFVVTGQHTYRGEGSGTPLPIAVRITHVGTALTVNSTARVAAEVSPSPSRGPQAGASTADGASAADGAASSDVADTSAAEVDPTSD